MQAPVRQVIPLSCSSITAVCNFFGFVFVFLVFFYPFVIFLIVGFCHFIFFFYVSLHVYVFVDVIYGSCLYIYVFPNYHFPGLKLVPEKPRDYCNTRISWHKNRPTATYSIHSNSVVVICFLWNQMIWKLNWNPGIAGPPRQASGRQHIHTSYG